VEISLTQPSSSQRHPWEEREVIREKRLMRLSQLRRILPNPPSYTSNFPFVHSQSTIVSFSTFPFEFMNPPTFPTIPSFWHGHFQDNARLLYNEGELEKENGGQSWMKSS
jgi:hypothetical protein